MGTEIEKPIENNDTKDQKVHDDKKGEKEFTPITSQEEFDAKLAGRLRRAVNSAKDDLRDELRQELEAEAKTQKAKEDNDLQALLDAESAKLQKAQERIKELEGDIAQRELTSVKAAVAKDAGLPDSAIEFLTGDDEASLKASAKKLASMVAKEEAANLDLGESNNSNRRQSQPPKDDKFADPVTWGLPTG